MPRIFDRILSSLFGLKPTNDAEVRLRKGVPILAGVLARSGFTFKLLDSGASSGGDFASGEFIRGNRRLEVHVRDNLGLIRYHVGPHSASHEYYMKELGVRPNCQYPGFPNDPLDPFLRLAHDLSFAGEFLSGDARLLLHASQSEQAACAERARQDMQGYVGDLRTLEQMRRAFREGAYSKVAQLAETLVLPDRISTSQRRMIDLAKGRSQAGRNT